MGRKLLLIVFIGILVSGVAIRRFPRGFLFSGKNEAVKTGDIVFQEPERKADIVSEKEAPSGLEESVQGARLSGQGFAFGEKKDPQSSLIENVPFTVQAPFGEWNISTFQNGCEEAAVVMSAYFISEEPLPKDIAKKEIIALTRFEDKKHGQSIDTSARDTEKLFKEYYNITTTEIRMDITLLDIQETLATGAIVIVPADGRKLHNPNYKQPGPTTHMLVVIGYDAEKKEFITNDSGTRMGKGYRYKEDILYEAIRDYPTGDHLPIREVQKNMIVVKKL